MYQKALSNSDIAGKIVMLLLSLLAKGTCECWNGKKSAEYNGSVSITENGRICQAWTAKIPHDHNYTNAIYFPSDNYSVAAAENFCRDPGGVVGRTWCYTMDENVLWEYCNPPTCKLSQWVSKVLHFSSQYSDRFANSVEGPPDVYPLYGDYPGVWRQNITNSVQYIVIEYEHPVYVTGIDIYETYNAGGVKAVSGNTPQGYWQYLWENDAQYKQHGHGANIFSPPLQNVNFRISRVLLEIDCPAIGTWVAIDAVRLNGTLEKTETVHCSQNFSFDYGMLFSPNYPKPYSPEASCVWIVSVSEGHILALTFTDLDLEDDDSCHYDYVEVRDGPNDKAPLLGFFCGDRLPAAINATSNTLYVKFKSDLTLAGAGFRATWGILTGQQCGANYFLESGILVSPNFQNPYSDGEYCVWTIRGDNDDIVTLTFIDLIIGHDLDCNVDYVEIRDGLSDNDPLIGHYCGFPDPNPSPVVTIGSSMLVKFESTIGTREVGNGFRAVWSLVKSLCGRSYHEDYGTIVSPNYPDPYYNGAVCIWKITVNETMPVTLTFTDMNLEDIQNCEYDFVEIRDGLDESAELLGHFCGNQLPVAVTTTDNSMYIKFKSDVSVARSGFRATWKVDQEGTTEAQDVVGNGKMTYAPEDSFNGASVPCVSMDFGRIRRCQACCGHNARYLWRLVSFWGLPILIQYFPTTVLF